MAEFDEYITPDGKVYPLNFSSGRFVLSVEGTGMPEIDYITQTGPYQHGMTIYDYRLKPRTIQYIYKYVACDRFGYWDARAELLNYLRPNRQTSGFTLGKLRKKLPDGTMRDIDVIINNGPRFQARNLDAWEEAVITETLIFIAPDPTFYNPTQQCSTWVLTASDHLIFPFSFTYGGAGSDIQFSSSVISNLVTVTYNGTWLSYPTIEITGPINGLTITNTSTGEFIKLNYDIGGGEVVTIDLRYGNKTVTNAGGANLIGTVTTDSDLATFHIAPDPEVASGTNILSVVGSGAVIGTTAVKISYYERYIGI